MSGIADKYQELDAQTVFQINDIALRIPPSNISVSREDLTHTNRVIRSKVTTKTPSGHGYLGVQLTGAVKYSQMMDLHRLIVQVQNSPFVYVKNDFLRETAFGGMEKFDNMAFTVNAMNLAPMPGSSDTFVYQIEMQYFNYKPYTDNFLYRLDWTTKKLVEENAKSNSDYFIRKTIGWDIDPNTFKKSHRIVIVEEQEVGAAGPQFGGVKQYEVVKDEYRTNKIRTIEDMEKLHPGSFFDLNPLPGNMEPTLPVQNPKLSRICQILKLPAARCTSY